MLILTLTLYSEKFHNHNIAIVNININNSYIVIATFPFFIYEFSFNIQFEFFSLNPAVFSQYIAEFPPFLFFFCRLSLLSCPSIVLQVLSFWNWSSTHTHFPRETSVAPFTLLTSFLIFSLCFLELASYWWANQGGLFPITQEAYKTISAN